MGKYKPLYISGYKTGLVQSRENFLLPNDAYPVLENAYIWRERILRKQGTDLLGRLRRVLIGQNLGIIDGAGNFAGNIITILGLEAGAHFECESFSITVGGFVLTDPAGDGILVSVPAGPSGTINYVTGAITLTGLVPGTPIIANFNYYPNLPVMGIRTREVNNINFENTLFFDQVYCYIIGPTGFQEFIPGTTWTGSDSNFFWSTNYWVDSFAFGINNKIFWATNFSGVGGDPIRYTNGTAWDPFNPQINGADQLHQCLAILPFRGRLLAFNTYEGPLLANSVQYPQRIRWSQIGTPFTVATAIVPAANVNVNGWREDIRGNGSYLDIPTAEHIVSVGFVRDNLVIYCERSTWQLRYTGRTINPFEIEKVNTELGTESTFSAIQFDTSLVGIGDKGIVECDSFKSNRIDIKIPDLVFGFNNVQQGPERIHGARDFERRVAYWIYPDGQAPRSSSNPLVYPNRRLLYNYENDSWAIFEDSLTAIGPFQAPVPRTWASVPEPWEEQNYAWAQKILRVPLVVGGNQQGYVSYLDQDTTNDVSLAINSITGNTTTATNIESINHNLQTGQWIQIVDIPTGTPFNNLNGLVFYVQVVDTDNFTLWQYSATNPPSYLVPQLDPPGIFIGCGQIKVRDNFRIQSKKFNALEEGQAIQIGHIDVFMDKTSSGAITMQMYVDYNNSEPTNIYPQNIQNPLTSVSDPFFNSTVPTTNASTFDSDKIWHRVYCSTRGTFLTIQWTLSDAQMAGTEQEQVVQIDSQVIWMRKAGSQLPLGV